MYISECCKAGRRGIMICIQLAIVVLVRIPIKSTEAKSQLTVHRESSSLALPTMDLFFNLPAWKEPMANGELH